MPKSQKLPNAFADHPSPNFKRLVSPGGQPTEKIKQLLLLLLSGSLYIRIPMVCSKSSDQMLVQAFSFFMAKVGILVAIFCTS